MGNFFKVDYRSKKSKARLGLIKTAHGVIKTPAFVPVATKGTLKALSPNLTKEIGIQVSFVNTYHLVTHPGAEIIAKAGGIHTYSRLNYPLMSDSGGFQVFSLAKNQHSTLRVDRSGSYHPEGGSSKYQRKADIRGEEQPLVHKITEDGVIFRSVYDGKLVEFTPEKSIENQNKIGADLIMAFDECTYYPSTHEYAKKSMDRTHEWLKRCISKFRNSDFEIRNQQYLYGIIQGGTYKDLRVESAKFVAEQDTDGVAIGGVSVGETKKEMREQVQWVADYLPRDKPVHLLGVGHLDDIVDLIKYGIDTFDCVEPTRLARMGTLYLTSKFEIRNLKSAEMDILKGRYKDDLSPVDENCSCYVCKNFSKSYLHHLFKQKEILGYTLATYHNLWIMEKLFEKIRRNIEENKI